MIKRDPYNHEEKWNSWIKKNDNGIHGISKRNSDIILEFLKDMEVGKNVSPFSRKGERSYIRLTTLADKMLFYARNFNKPLDKLTKNDVHKVFSDMQKGILKKIDGTKYIATGNYIKDFKCFWGWAGDIDLDLLLEKTQ